MSSTRSLTVHLRVARDSSARDLYRVDAAMKPRAGALRDTEGRDLWTIRLALELRVDDAVLRPPAAATVSIDVPDTLIRSIEPMLTDPAELASDHPSSEEDPDA